jgi:hypothetical protein
VSGFWRELELDASWKERLALHRIALERVHRSPEVQRALALAAEALDACCEQAIASDAAKNAEIARAFALAVASAIGTLVRAEPALLEIAMPGPELDPPVRTASLPVLAQMVMLGLLRIRIRRDAHPVAVALYLEYIGDAKLPTSTSLDTEPRSLRDLSALVGAPRRRRGAPAGGEMPPLSELLRRMRKITSRPGNDRVTLEWVAGKMGYGERTLRTWLNHYGVRPSGLLRAEREARTKR